MAWLWWLLAPVAVTCLGAAVLHWRDAGRRSRPGDPIAEHRALLLALAELQPAQAALANAGPDGVVTDRVETDQPVPGGLTSDR